MSDVRGVGLRVKDCADVDVFLRSLVGNLYYREEREKALRLHKRYRPSCQETHNPMQIVTQDYERG